MVYDTKYIIEGNTHVEHGHKTVIKFIKYLLDIITRKLRKSLLL